PNFVVIGGMRADRERQSMTIHDCHDFHAFPALRRSDPRPATLRHHERRIDEAFRFIQGAEEAKNTVCCFSFSEEDLPFDEVRASHCGPLNRQEPTTPTS